MPRTPTGSVRRLVMCVNNAANPASLETRKLYESLPDAGATKAGLVRVVDESGEDYLYPRQWFVPVSASAELRQAFLKAS